MKAKEENDNLLNHLDDVTLNLKNVEMTFKTRFNELSNQAKKAAADPRKVVGQSENECDNFKLLGEALEKNDIDTYVKILDKCPNKNPKIFHPIPAAGKDCVSMKRSR